IDIFHILLCEGPHRDIINVDFQFPDQMQQQIKRPLEYIQLYIIYIHKNYLSLGSCMSLKTADLLEFYNELIIKQDYFECHEIMEEAWKSKAERSKEDPEVFLILMAV